MERVPTQERIKILKNQLNFLKLAATQEKRSSQELLHLEALIKLKEAELKKLEDQISLG